MNNLKKYGLILLALAAAYGTGRYLAPAKVETKEVVKTNTEYITRVVTTKDGTVIKETIKKDQVTKDTSTKVETQKPQYKAGAVAKLALNDGTVSYGAIVERRVLGNIFMGVYADTQRTVGVTASMEF